MTKLSLGTRKSLLAWAQSSWVAREVERLNPGVEVELIGIETRGDKIQDVPLQSVPGKEFFVAELDEALAEGRVDLNVHSLKDLSLDRPAAFICAAIPPRENPRDVVLFGPGVMDKLRAGRALRIGTSSPRRLENIPGFLRKALPRLGGEPRVDLVEIRGNVNTRLSRVHEAEGSPKQLDAVVLAFAGLIRLWRDEGARGEMTRLLEGVRWMVLPLKECPAAPGQGALAVECRRDDARTREALSRLHHLPSEHDVAMERSLLAQWGGGCHQKFGATAISIPGLRDLFFIRGAKPDGEFVDELRWPKPVREGEARGWNGGEWKAEARAIKLPRLNVEDNAVFVAHFRALPESEDLKGARVWTSGTSSWLKLAEKGIWVEGSAEGLGFENLMSTLREPILNLPELPEWLVLTHVDAARGWNSVNVLITYKLEETPVSTDAIESLRGATDIFWSSASQFDELRMHAPEGARHACGPGKTANHIQRLGMSPLIFPSSEEWSRWIKT